MTRLIIAALLFLPLAHAQSAADILNALEAARTTTTIALSITASQGDGTICLIKKLSGSSIAASLTCQSGDAKTVINSGTIRATGTPQSFVWGFGDVVCIIDTNPTAASITVGSLGPLAAVSLGWECSTNIRTGGSVTGQTAVVTGSVAWP